MNIVVLDAKTFGEDLDLSPLETRGEVTVYALTPPELVVERLENADVAVLNKVKMTAEILEKLPKLRLICIMATGFDNVDVAFCHQKGIGVSNVVGYSTHNVAQVTVAMVLSLCTELPIYARHVSSGAYTQGGVQNILTPVYHEIAGKTWGIVGYGNIGKQVGRVAETMGCRVLVYRKTETDDPRQVSLETLLRESDIVSLHVPLSAGTKNLIDRHALSLMKPNAMLINVARGAVTDEAAVAEAIVNRKLGFFGADVYATEPFDVKHPFTKIATYPNVCLTPHMAWGSYEARRRCLSETVENIAAFQKGEFRNRVDMKAGDGA